MAGNKERERAVDRKLVAEMEHLIPRVRGSEKMKEVAEKEKEKEKEAVMVVDKEKEVVTEQVPERRVRKKVQQQMQRVKQRLLVGGGVENEMDVD